MEMCCQGGKEFASNGTNCLRYNGKTIRDVRKTLKTLCSLKLRMCCKEELQKIQCEAGKKAAELNGRCENSSESFEVSKVI